MIDKTWNKCMIVIYCSILIGNPLDKRPTPDPISGSMIQYQHSGVNIGGLSFSSGFVFRCVTSLESYNVDNKAIQDKIPPVFGTDDLQKTFDHYKHYKSVLHVYDMACKGTL